MEFDGKFYLATGHSRNSKQWKNKEILWSDFVERIKEPVITSETYKEYLAASKDEQGKIKDVGGYVGGYVRTGRRKPENINYRQLVTLDVDFAPLSFWDSFTMSFGNAAVLHATHKHSEDTPRYRFILPLSRDVSPDEYIAIARKIAGLLNIDYFDTTGFQPERLMYWPSVSKDAKYYYEVQDGGWLDADEILNSYADWTDSSLWPTSSLESKIVKSNIEKQQDPETKKGLVGAFCRTYNISEAIEAFLADRYISTNQTDRYTYAKGSTAGGLVVYEDKFAYSHHGTDPCSSKLNNSFDLVRLHLFGQYDSEKTENKSFSMMEELASKDKAVKKTIAKEAVERVSYEFADYVEEETTEADLEFMEILEVDNKGRYLSTANNLNLIFANDIKLKDKFKRNAFDSRNYLFASVPWRKIAKPEVIRNVDYSGIRNYLECIYGITGVSKIEDALALELEAKTFHPVKDYLKSLEWDGEKRVDTLLIDYFQTKENIYTKEAIRKCLVGAVARIFNPGVKFDLVLTLVGSLQGSGKSSFFSALGREWFSDSFDGIKGKEAYEQLLGAWIMEMAELKGLRKAEVEAVKHYITKQADTYRPAFGKSVETFKRQCIFVATTNESEFLRDPSGNRRFMPVDVANVKLTENKKLVEFTKSKDTVNQVWAEVVHLYDKGEKLYLSPEAELIAEREQKGHSETDERLGIIDNYLDIELPTEWKGLDLYDRRAFLENPTEDETKEKRKFVCIPEIWCECLGKDRESMSRYNTREINELMRSLRNWKHVNSTKNFGSIYGKQKYYARKED